MTAIGFAIGALVLGAAGWFYARLVRRSSMVAAERLAANEADLAARSLALADRERVAVEREQELLEAERGAKEQLSRARARLDEAEGELARVASLSREQACEQLLRALEPQIRAESAALVVSMEQAATSEATERAAKILASALERVAPHVVAERCLTLVQLPSDELKGRIIGREGRNVRAFEALAGVDVIIDDTPGVVTVSSFSPERREVARYALEALVADGRIHPARIEEAVAAARQQAGERTRAAGEGAARAVDVVGLHPELVEHLGRLRLREHGGQSALEHATETARLAGALAAELGLDAGRGRRAGLLHDIGLAADAALGADHASAGAELLRRCGEDHQVVQAVRHHEGQRATSALAAVVQLASRIGRERPGARRGGFDAHAARVSSLEQIAAAVPGVAQAYALGGGGELRVIARAPEVSDAELVFLAREIARRVERDGQYVAEVRVSVVREARVSEVAQ